MKKIFTLLFILVSINVHSQSRFSRIYYETVSSNVANSSVKSFDGGLIIAGTHNYYSSVFKIDSTGVFQWGNSIGFGNNEVYSSVIRTFDSSYVIAGKIMGSVSLTLDLNIVKIDQAGNVLWNKAIGTGGSEELLSISQTADSGFVFAGYQSNLTAPYSDAVYGKISSAGALEWYYTYSSGNNANIATSIKQTADGGYALVGYGEDFPPFDSYGFLLKLNSNGVIDLAQRFNGSLPQFFIGNDLEVTGDAIYSYFSNSSENIIVKTDVAGNHIWDMTYPGLTYSSNCINCVTPKLKILANGNIVFVSGSPGSGFGSMSSMVNIDSTGLFRWGQILYNSCHDVCEADDGGLYILGNGPLIGVRTTTITDPHVGIIKSDSLGNADLCTEVSQGIGGAPNNVVRSVLIGTATLVSAGVSDMNITPIAYTVTEQNSCVDFMGGIDEASQMISNVYPNPSNDHLNIQLKNISGNVDVKIVDAVGKVVWQKNKVSLTDDLITLHHGLSSGFYSIEIVSNDKVDKDSFIVR